MKKQIYDLFPLTVLKEKIYLPSAEKEKLVKFIFQSEKNTDHIEKHERRAWLGDIRGQEFLFNNSEFAILMKLIAESIKSYTEIFHIDNNQIDYYFQRCWATITRKDEEIVFHDHSQSHISFAYYLLKPEHSGDIKFRADSQNEIASGLFENEIESGLFEYGSTKFSYKTIKKYDTRNSSAVEVEIEEDSIIMFPSKIKHSTLPSKSEKPRISISGDICIMLKDSFGHKKLMPNFKNWKLF